MSDETRETSDELIDSALPMINDSEHPQAIMASTFHKIFGRFAFSFMFFEKVYGTYGFEGKTYVTLKKFALRLPQHFDG